MSYFLHNAVVGLDADKPDPANPIGGAVDPASALYVAGDTGKIYQSTGKAWVQIAVIGGGGGSITDATTIAIGGVEVDHARSGAHSVALTTDGLALPAGMIGTTSSKACAGNDARLSDARDPTFSGASVQNIDVGQTTTSGQQLAPSFTSTIYDTDSYLVGGTHFVAPKTGYYAVVFGFQADGPFTGAYEAALRLPGIQPSAVSATGASTQPPECAVYDEGHMSAGDSVTFSMLQRSSGDQLLFPFARIHYLGT